MVEAVVGDVSKWWCVVSCGGREAAAGVVRERAKRTSEPGASDVRSLGLDGSDFVNNTDIESPGISPEIKMWLLNGFNAANLHILYNFSDPVCSLMPSLSRIPYPALPPWMVGRLCSRQARLEDAAPNRSFRYRIRSPPIMCRFPGLPVNECCSILL